MTASILSLARRKSAAAPLAPKMPWQNQDLAELYRVRDRLAAAGLSVEVDNGVSDEGDPWFIYQQTGTDNIVVHIARIDTQLHVINCVTGNVYVGTSFRDVSDRMLEDASLAVSSQIRRSSNVVIHPSVFLTAFVAAAIMLVDLIEHNRAEAAESQPGDGHAGLGDHPHVFSPQSEGSTHTESSEAGDDSTPVDDVAAHAGVSTARRLQKDGAASLVNGTATSQLASFGHAGFLIDGSGLALSLSAHIFAAELLGRISQDAAASEGTDDGLGEIADLSLTGESVWHAASAHTFAMSGHANAVALQTEGVPTGTADIGIDMSGLATLVAPPVAKVPDHPETVEVAPTAAEAAPAQPDALAHSASSAATTNSGSSADVVASTGDAGPSAESQANAATAPRQASAPAVEAANASGVQGASSGSVVAELATSARSILDSRALDWIVTNVIMDTDNAGTPGTTITTGTQDLPPADGSGPEPITGGLEVTDSLIAGRADLVYVVTGTSMVVEGFVLGEDLLVFAEGDIDSATSHAWQDGADLVMGDSDVGTIRLIGVLADTSGILYPPTTPASA